MIAAHHPIALTLPDGRERTYVAIVAGLDHGRAQDLLGEVRALVVAAGRSRVESDAIGLDLDLPPVLCAPAPLSHLATAAAAEIVAWLADDVTAAA